MAVGRHDRGRVEACFAREVRHVFGAFLHAAVLGSDGGQGDPVLHALDGGVAAGFGGFANRRIALGRCRRGMRAEDHCTRAGQRGGSQELATIKVVRHCCSSSLGPDVVGGQFCKCPGCVRNRLQAKGTNRRNDPPTDVMNASSTIVRKELLTAAIAGRKDVARVEIKQIDFGRRNEPGCIAIRAPWSATSRAERSAFRSRASPRSSSRKAAHSSSPPVRRSCSFDNASSDAPATFVAFYLLGPDDRKIIEML